MYDWNWGGNFDWYLRHSKLNAVELNASFYRFPFPSQVKAWSRKSRIFRLRWAVKVHRSITHYKRLSKNAIIVWEKFHNLFLPLEETDLLDFYLFQMPPNFIKKDKNIQKIVNFLKESGLEPWRMALELRHESWFNEDTIEWARSLGITIVSIDAPIATWIVNSNGIIYLRMHGKTEWYAHDYSLEELEIIANKIRYLKPNKVYVFFNNNHWMLENALEMKKILEES